MDASQYTISHGMPFLNGNPPATAVFGQFVGLQKSYFEKQQQPQLLVNAVALTQSGAPPTNEKENPTLSVPSDKTGATKPLRELKPLELKSRSDNAFEGLQRSLENQQYPVKHTPLHPQQVVNLVQPINFGAPTQFLLTTTAAPAILSKQSSSDSLSSTSSVVSSSSQQRKKTRAECQLVKVGKRMDLLALADQLGMICRRRHRENMYFDCKDKYSYSCNVKMILRPMKQKHNVEIPESDEVMYELLRRGDHNEHLSCQEKNPRGLSKRAKVHLREMLKESVGCSARDLFDMLQKRYPEDLRPETSLRQVQNFINHEKAVGEIREKKQKQKLTALALAPPSAKSSDKQKMLQGLPKLSLPKVVRKVPAEKLLRNQKKRTSSDSSDDGAAKKAARKKRLSEVAVEALQAMRQSKVTAKKPEPKMTTLVFVPQQASSSSLATVQEEPLSPTDVAMSTA